MEDFLARIKGRLVKRSGHLTPQERQQRFRQRYAAIGSAHAAAVAAAADADAAAADAAALRPVQQTEIPECLQYLVDQLVRENVSAGERLDDGACTELFLSENMLDALEAQSAADVPLGYRSQLIQSATTLVTMLDEMMVAQRAFHLPLQRLLKTATAQPKFPYQDALLELEYAIAAKIHGAPRLIPLFFEKPLSPDASAPSTSSPALTTAPAGSSEPTWAFPLLDHLLQYLHLEGRRGDVARTAVLALLECTDDDLAAYIDRTEFHNIVVAGLGGLFSQLPSRLPRHAMSQADGPGAAGAVPAGAAAAPPTRIVALGVTTFRADLNALVCLLNWVQSVFTRCSHPRLLQRLASHIEQIFFAQILSTALMDASDFDGTAATALAYTTLMAQTITVPPLAEAFCQVLLGAEDSDARRAGGDDMDADPPPGTPASVLSARSRVDLELTVRDILLSKTSSLVEDVAVASLQLLQILVFQHGPFAVNALFEHLPFTTLEGWPMARERVSAIHQHNHLLMRYYELAEQSRAIMGDAATDADASRRSSVASLRSPSQHDTLRHVPAPLRRFSDLETTPHAAHGTVEAYVHDAWAAHLRRMARDPTLRKLMASLANFFSNAFAYNLVLTGMLSTLVKQPDPTLHFYLLHADLLMPAAGSVTVPGPLAGAPSLYTLLRQRWSEVESRRQADPRRFAEQVRAASVFLFEGEYDRAQALGAGGSSWFVTTAPASASPAGGAGPDPEHEYFLNVIILQEFIKEVLGVQLASLMSPYVHVAYV
ncbi:hypothetical protein CXG81DRAFT_11760 [Caulochytrium protostelioides]|uniref:FHF complex subunit HOOK-interacting protein C-terminal domain-containing protein n=1 Tax=Caulochytrium protostelioides TaxID=1555241 RepID=A0A4P9X8N6_9FUNG|nr:hypothetical protein CXG81DRAFT_11760 [Caulochytrium protostelioides]|eukprot:RKP01622.1 hypothetical protein CXG81DRAFT_11760 [Caulochytrium protostelioides]